MSGTAERVDSAEINRLRLNLSMLRMADSLVSVGFYSHDYIPSATPNRAATNSAQKDWEPSEASALCDRHVVRQSDIQTMTRNASTLATALFRILSQASPLSVIEKASLSNADSLQTKDAKRSAMQCMLELEGEQVYVVYVVYAV